MQGPLPPWTYLQRIIQKIGENFPLARIFELDIFALECAYACRHCTGLPYSV